ncbi:MAG: efflux RND transporter periplasmic adaptor subunit [Desulfuromonadia bacterium]
MKHLSTTFLLGVVSLSLFACSPRHGGGEKGTAAPPVVTGARIETVTRQEVPEDAVIPGTVKASTSALVAARIPGTITRLSAAEGTRVKAGGILAQITAQESVSGFRAASSAVTEAERGVDDARARLALAESTLKRFQALYREQAVTRQELDVREMEHEVARQNLSRAEARLAQAREGEKGAAAVAGYTTVTAPISGIVAKRQVELGSTVFPGSPLFVIDDEKSYRLELSVPESLMGRVKVGMPVEIRLDGVDRPVSGMIVEIVPSLDPATRTFIAKASLPGALARSGQFGRGLFRVGTTPSLLVPASAIQPKGALTAVWVVENGAARLRIVRTGKQVGDRVEILSGISQGERVITGGTFPAVEGSKVQ